MRGSRFPSAMMQPRCARAPHPAPHMRSYHPPRSPVDTVVSFDAWCGREAYQPPRCETRPRGNLFARYYEAGDSTCSGTLKHVEEGVQASYLSPFMDTSTGCSDLTPLDLVGDGTPLSMKHSCSADGTTALQAIYRSSDCSGNPLSSPADVGCRCKSKTNVPPWAKYVSQSP